MKLLNFYLSRYPLYISGTRDVRFEIPEDSERKAIFRYKVTLPAYVTCTQCVIQWNYYTGSYYITIVYVNFGRMCSLHIYISIMETKYKRNNYRNSNIQTRFTLTLRILRSGVHIFSNNFSMLFITTYDYTIYHQVICGVLVKMEPKPMDVEDQRRLEIAPTWASLLVQLGYLPSSYNKTIPFCSITKIIVLPIIYSHLSSGKYRSSIVSVSLIDDHLRYNRDKR